MDPLSGKRKVKRIVWKRSKDKFGEVIYGSKDNFGEVISDEIDNSLAKSQDDVRKRLRGEPLRLDVSSSYNTFNGSQICGASMNCQKDSQGKQISHPTDLLPVYPKGHGADGPHMLCALPIPDTQQLSPSVSVILSGTAHRRNAGPPVGAIDIGVSESAYYFRVALPGVRKDPGDFSCEVEYDGKVHINGVTTTGEKTVSRYSRVYNMTFQQQCPPGPFTLTFCLPGPVDPSLFSPNFRTDGVFEGVVVKYNYA